MAQEDLSENGLIVLSTSLVEKAISENQTSD